MPTLFNQVIPNFGPLVTDPVITDSDYFGKSLFITELAESIKPLLQTNAVRDLFPEETIEADYIKVVQEFEPIGTTLPIVQKGMPDTILDQGGRVTNEWTVQPFYMRGSFQVTHGEINSRVKPGTTNERWSPAEQIQKRIKNMMEAHELTWDVFRTYMLCGGIDITDPRTKHRIQVPSNIPARNLFNYSVKNGYKGRQEHAWFRTIVDSNVSDPGSAPSGIPWTHPDAAIIECVRHYAMWYEMTHKRPITAMYMHPEMRYVLSMNNQIKMALGGFIPAFGVTAGQSTLANDPVIINNGGVGVNGLSVDGNGNLLSIAGIPIKLVDVKYKDPRDGVYQGIMPKNKIIFVSEQLPSGARVMPGATQYCISEESQGKPGMWSRMQDQTVIPNAPGMAFQLGNAGMVYLRHPEAVSHMTVCEVEDIQKRLVILGDIAQGIF
jgi:hypothetical protein